MCQFISFFHNPNTDKIKVYDLCGHSQTSEALNLDLKVWREGHYLPNGTVECRVLSTDRKTQAECNEQLLSKWPTFKDFLTMCLATIGKKYGGNLYLSGCDLKGIVLPESVGGSLYLRGCDLKGVKIPEKFKNKVIKVQLLTYTVAGVFITTINPAVGGLYDTFAGMVIFAW